MGVPKNLAGLDLDIWYLVIQNLDAGRDIYNMCLVSKDLNPFATTRLYSALVIGPSPPKIGRFRFNSIEGRNMRYVKSRTTQWAQSRALVRRLAGDRDGPHARAVLEVEVAAFRSDERRVVAEFEQESTLSMLVKALPNLKQFRLRSSMVDCEDLDRALSEHGNHPELHLLEEDGSRVVSGPLLSVTTLNASVNPYNDTPEQQNRRIPGLQKLFFACPNLKSSSISTYGNYGGCVIRIPHHPRIFTFELTGEETFPPLESLSLRDFNIEHWRGIFDWSGLRTFSLGPQRITTVLQLLKGHANALRSLTVRAWAGEAEEYEELEEDYGEEDSDGEEEEYDTYRQYRRFCSNLEDYLLSFDTLEQLTVKGHFVSNAALGHHPRLKHLCLHNMELPLHKAHRPTLDVASLGELDANCPDLETLEIDIQRSSEWPEDIIKALASGFANLRSLTLHCEVGIDWANAWQSTWESRDPLLPLLDGDLAKAFAQPFFALRPLSKLRSLTLKTGEDLRRFPQRTPGYFDDERAWSRTLHIRAPSSPGAKLKVVAEGDYVP